MTVELTRDEIKEKINGYRSLPEAILDGVGAVIGNLGRRYYQEGFGLPPYWLNGAIIALITFMIGWLTSLALRETLSSEEIYLSIWAAVSGPLALIAIRANMRNFLNAFQESLLDKMQSVSDLRDLDRWLANHFGARGPFLTGLVLGPSIAFVLIWSRIGNGSSVKIGTIVTTVLACFQAIMVAYYLYPFFVSLPARLRRYRFDLYTTDPSSSEVIGRLSQLLTFSLYVTVAYIVQLTLGMTYFKILTLGTVLIFSVIVWAPTVLLYAQGQYNLSAIIMQAKWKTLNEIQDRIDALNTEAELSKDNLDRIDGLMNFHDRVKNTPNSALNLRSGLNFLNSMLLPVLAFVLANLNNVLVFIKTAFSR